MTAYILARDIGHARALHTDMPHAAVIAGGTAAQLGWPDGRYDGPLIDLSRIPAPAPVDDGALYLSAFSRLEHLRQDRVVAHACPQLAQMLGQIAAPAVRNIATLGGNIGWRSGDLVPLLLVLGAEVDLNGWMKVQDALSLPHLPLFTRVRIPPVQGPLTMEKVARRAAFAPSALTVVILGQAGHEHIAVGGAGVVPQMRGTADGFTFPDNIHGTAAYRHRLVHNFLDLHRRGQNV